MNAAPAEFTKPTRWHILDPWTGETSCRRKVEGLSTMPEPEARSLVKVDQTDELCYVCLSKIGALPS